MASTQKETFDTQIANMIRARFSLMYFTTWEELRVIQFFNGVCKNPDIFKTPRKVHIWSQSAGIDSTDTKKLPAEVLGYIKNYHESAVFILKDFHVFIDPKSKNYDYANIRMLRDLVEDLRTSEATKNVIILSPVTVIPIEIQKDIAIIDFDLPSVEDIEEKLNEFIEANQGIGKINLSESEKIDLCEAAKGLTLQEAENAFARSLVQDRCLDISDKKIVMEEKKQILKKTGILEYIDSDMDFNAIGGLENLKRWLLKRERAWSREAERYCVNRPKGILITGVPGCGKSLTAKVVGSVWNMPLLRLDIGSIFGSLVGSSEENMRRAIKTAEALAPCIFWIDEVEKGFSGVSGAGDSGVSSRIFGTFLTWMQEKKSDVFVIATANNISALPSEFMRKGRFDEIFFVDIPTLKERKMIFEIHLKRRLRDSFVGSEVNVGEQLLTQLAEASEGFVGAEIEELVVSALFEAFSQNRALQLTDLEMAIKNTVPLSVTQEEQIRAIRTWANTRAVAATAYDDRSDYVNQDGNSDEQVPKAPSVSNSRGGRTVEF